MPLILWISKLLALEYVSQMSSAVVAHNFYPHHAQPRVGLLAHCARYCVPESGPAAARVELVVGFVERRVAATACVDAGSRIVLVELTGAWHFGSFLAQDTELF